MRTFELYLPDIGEGVTEAELVTWLVSPGERVRVDDPIAEVMTDKATVELPSPVNGTVAWLAVEEGQRVAVGAPVARFELEDADSETPQPDTPASTSLPTAQEEREPTGVPPIRAGRPSSGVGAGQARGSSGDAPRPPLTHVTSAEPGPADAPVVRGVVSGASGRPLASPAVRRRAVEAGVDLRLIRGSGPAGRIEHRDLDRVLEGSTMMTTVGPVGGMLDTSVIDVAVNGIRRVIAERMSQAATHIPHITYVEEIDVTELERLRAHMNGSRPEGSRKLTPLPFVVQALVAAIAEHPDVNAHFDDDAMAVHRFGGVHMGIAVQTPKGLMVPVMRHAEALNIWECADEIQRLSTAARQGTLERAELVGSTITVTSLGALGGVVTTPIINRPEVAIVGVNKMQVRPVWDGSAFIPRSVMNLSSSFDHRIIDGWDAAAFIGHVKELIEQPALLFMKRR